MRIITKENTQIRKGDGNPFITVFSEGVYFTASTVNECNIQHNARVNFIQDKQLWSFYCHLDTEGFLIQRYGSGFRIHSKPLVRMIKKSLRIQEEIFSLYIKPTGEQIDGHDIIRILTDKKVE